MKLLRVRRGHSPNCSATGSVVGLALASAVGCAAIVNAFADRFLAWAGSAPPPDGTDGSPPGNADDPSSPEPQAMPRLRMESFGGILAWPSPPALLYLDDQGAREALAAGATPIGDPVTREQAPPTGALSAPTEAHISLTDRCPVKCTGCYLNAGPQEQGMAVHEDLESDLDALAEMGVFEIALGGGEVALHEDLIGVCERIRARGMTPNVTTSGFGMTPALAESLAPLVGQINVSYDGTGDAYAATRGWRGERIAQQAIETLKSAGIRVGINTVLTRHNLHDLDAMARVLAHLEVDEWQWLRFKPAGRGRASWDTLAPSSASLLDVWPKALELEDRFGLAIRFDCALVPFLAAHNLPVAQMESLGITGCPGGESLWARSTQGRWTPCSFAHDLSSPKREASPNQIWREEPTLHAWRARAQQPEGPCAECDYRAVCRGGCRVVAHHLTGDALAPDPQCPRVQRAANP